ncbi:MAG: PaaI family thioesterase [Actinomycetia bacterium]|nr:PaaI family thioesterase [Actinomycetes bacterium]MCP4083578.1 PaaI family thioesterase [Actinomycetes bacterium]
MAAALTFEHWNPELAERMKARSTQSIDGFLGIQVADFQAGSLVAEFEVRDELVTMIGNIHGGCITAFVDHCLGVIMYPIMPKRSWAATTEFKINLLAPVSEGKVIASAEVVSMSKRQAVVTIQVENQERLVAVAQGTVTIVPPRPPADGAS